LISHQDISTTLTVPVLADDSAIREICWPGVTVSISGGELAAKDALPALPKVAAAVEVPMVK
jgi:hypothetical protein